MSSQGDEEGSQAVSENVIERVYEIEFKVGEHEKSNILTCLNDMRNDSSFCDVAFLCHGKLFRAHRVVVAAWSRWLRGLLYDNSPNEVISLDIFQPECFEAVLHYMYGLPLLYTLNIAEGVIKVVRRLEMAQLEQHCWRFLIGIIDSQNCEFLHELADRYDCPPLKLTAWRILQESLPGYANRPADMLNDPQRLQDISHGLTGPGEKEYLQGYIEAEQLIEDLDDREEDEEQPSILPNGTYYYPGVSKYTNEQDDDDETRSSSSEVKPVYVDPKTLPVDAKAADVVRAWASKLQVVKKQCEPSEEYDDTEPLEDIRYKYVETRVTSSPSRTVERENRVVKERPVTTTAPVAPAGPTISPQRVVGAQNMVSPTVTTLSVAHRRLLGEYDWKGELRKFYLSINMPEKIATLDDILKIWMGKEDRMLSSLLIKYRKIVPPEMADHMEQLIAQVETQSDMGDYDIDSPAHRGGVRGGVISSGRR